MVVEKLFDGMPPLPTHPVMILANLLSSLKEV